MEGTLSKSLSKPILHRGKYGKRLKLKGIRSISQTPAKFMKRRIATQRNVFHHPRLNKTSTTPLMVKTPVKRLRAASCMESPVKPMYKKSIEDMKSLSLKEAPLQIYKKKKGCCLTNDNIIKLYIARNKDLGYKNFMPSQINLTKFQRYCYTYSYGRRICFQKCGFGLNCAFEISRIILATPNISRLNLTGNRLGNSGVIALSNAIAKNKSIISLNLSSNEIRAEGAKVLLKSIEGNNSIIELNISSIGMDTKNRIRALGIKPFTSLLQNNKIMTFLNVSGNNIGKEGLDYIIQGLKHNRSLLSLKISKNSLSGECMTELFETIQHTAIIELDISGNPIGNLRAPEYTEELMMCTKIQSLNISDCNLTNHGLDCFFKNLSHKEGNLNTFIADKNDFKSCFSQKLIRFLSSNKALKKISLAGCNLGSDGVKSFCCGAVNNLKIKEINLARNMISDSVVYHILKPLLMRGCLLESLDLSDNDIGDNGGLLLAEVIEENRIIKKINIKNNLIQIEGGKAIRNALFNRQRCNLIMLNLALNPIDMKLSQEIEDMIYDNKIKSKKDTTSLKYEKMDYRNDEEILKKTLKEIERRKRDSVAEQQRINQYKIQSVKEKDKLVEEEKLLKKDELKQKMASAVVNHRLQDVNERYAKSHNSLVKAISRYEGSAKHIASGVSQGDIWGCFRPEIWA
ncbi:unnamed protein product [Moneuplotes crassus]|uniref:Leucine-rich repeat protein n=1 Tax=Euplotes crassus TaxID=5936 RepID=A0AAD1XVV3_EUPCR|nr:unnamed protein product [Moneuplotes crassus]